jgi:5'-nucleotidase
MEKDNEVLVVAPDEQKSASGHSITINRPIIVKEVKIEGIKSRAFSVNGTPADCVKIAMEKLLEDRVDVVMSGINHGLNVGTDVIYSGTVSAAIEGVIYKIPSMAVSMDVNNNDESLETAAKYANEILLNACRNNIKNDIVLNVNMPANMDKGIKGIKVCQLGNRIYTNCYIEAAVENNEVGFRLQGEVCDELDENTDVHYIKEKFITVTPLHYDLTNFKVLNEVDGWFRNNG